MINQKNTAIFIPTRLAATRLPNKPLELINNQPMIIHVWKRAIEASLGKVVVATDSEEIDKIVKQEGGISIVTDMKHQSGSDRIYEALIKIDPNNEIKYIINLQGDLPNILGKNLKQVLNILKSDQYDIGTLVAKINSDDDLNNSNIVKALCNFNEEEIVTKAIDFTRSYDHSINEKLFHHIGIYSYRRSSLERFINLPQSSRETLFKLEQLRALDNNMNIGAALIDNVPIGVDTHEDLELVRNTMRLK
jgi:3-deoxy-manno-octulosonate cytidylyltransferase (CMP-KDO synthetase)